MPNVQKQFALKDLIKMKELDVLTGLKIGALVGVKSATLLKTDLAVKNDLKIRSDLKSLLKDDVMLKTKSQTALKQPQKLKTQLRSLLKVETGFSPTLFSLTPIIRPPRTPTPRKPFIPKPVIFGLPKTKLGKGKKKKSEYKFDQAYLPDFTSRSIGLEAESVTEKQALARVKKVLTGLEVRRGIKLK